MRTGQAIRHVGMREELLRRVGDLSPTDDSMVQAYKLGDTSKLTEVRNKMRSMIREEDKLEIAAGPSIEEIHGGCEF